MKDFRKTFMMFIEELRYSWGFVLFMILQLTASMILLNYALTASYYKGADMNFYNKKVADSSFVHFGGENFLHDNTVEELSKLMNFDNLATTAVIGEREEIVKDESTGEIKVIYSDKVKVMTPSLINNFDTFAIKKVDSKSNYPTAYVNKYTGYEINQQVNLNCLTSAGEVKSLQFEVAGYFDKSDFGYNFDSILSSPISNISNEGVIIIDEITNYPFVKLESGIFVGDTDQQKYANLGAEVKSVQEVYDHIISYRDNTYFQTLVFSIIIFLCLTTFSLYYNNLTKLMRRRSVSYVLGITIKKMNIIELLKMVFIFALPLIINLVIVIIANLPIFFHLNGIFIVSYQYFVVSTLILFGLYLVSIALGIFKLFKGNVMMDINDQNLE